MERPISFIRPPLPRSRITALGLSIAACVTAFALMPSPASAGVPGSGDAACASEALTQPFLPWADGSQYAAIPGGNFEAGLSGWSADGTVTTAAENEPWHVGDAADASSVVLAPGASITSPGFCGGLTHPTVRLFARSTDATRLPVALVTVLYTGPGGLLTGLPLGVILPGGDWQPSITALTASGLPILTGSQLALKITSLNGSIAIDDAYVDPYKSR